MILRLCINLLNKVQDALLTQLLGQFIEVYKGQLFKRQISFETSLLPILLQHYETLVVRFVP